MSQKKIKIKSNSGPGLSEAFSNPDYEIQPVMIEVWDGKRIAWAIAILMALILIPVAALLIDSYQKDSIIGTEQLVSRADSPENVILAVNESEVEPRSAAQTLGSPALDQSPAQQSVEVAPDQDTVVTVSTELLPADQPSSAMSADTEAGVNEPVIEPDQLKTVTGNSGIAVKDTAAITVISENPELQSESQPVLNAKPAKVLPKVENAIKPMRLADLEQPEKQLLKQVQTSQATTDTVTQEQVSTDKAVSDELTTISTQTGSTQTGATSTHVSRSKLVKSIENREPVGNEVDVINLSGGDAVRLYYFTEVNGMAGQTISYRWLYEGNLIYSKPVVIKGNYTWRSYIGKLIPASMSGNWMVEVVDSENRQLVSKSFQAL
ncbi:MAG: DUF2914 domain-containing protein [Gammaproteobacteria bacterium]|nr:DUF2914 domain-containing protein [Gammaproteobacteria bacterium]